MNNNEQIIKKAKKLINAMDKNHFNLWDANLNDTHSCIIFDGGDITTEYEEGIKEKYQGISKEYDELKEAFEKNK